MPRFRPTLTALATALALSPAVASAQFSGAFVFGDSLSDAGQFGARFTTNPGLTFPMYVTQRYGISVTPSDQGGTDWAIGGALVNQPQGNLPPGIPDLSVAAQVTAQLAKGPLNQGALYQIQGGANDIFTLSAKYAAGQITAAQLQGGVAQAAVDLATQVGRLQAAGARYIVVYNVPDIGTTPAYRAIHQEAAGTQLSSLFNTTLNSALQGAGLQVIQVNAFLLTQEIAANPAAFGFVNNTLPVCTTASSLTCTPQTLRDPTGNLTWVFADGVHPTTGTALLAASAAESMVEAPAKIGALAEAPIQVEQANFRSIDGRMFTGLGGTKTPNKVNAWVAYDYAHNDIDGPFLSGTANQNTITGGIDTRVNDHLLIGVALGYSQNKGDFGGDTGNYTLHESLGTFYAGWGDGPWYIGGTIGGGSLDYTNITRSIQLGALARDETGSPRGWTGYGSVLGGYWFQWDKLTHGPWVRFTYQEIRVNAYAENGSDSTALQFGEQRRKSAITSLGWQGVGDFNTFRPYARITWEIESKDNERLVTAQPVTLGTSYSMPTIKPDNSWANFLVGTTANFGSVIGYLNGTATAGKSDGNVYSVTVGVRIPL